MERVISASCVLGRSWRLFLLITSGPVPSAPVRIWRTTGQRSSSSLNIDSPRRDESVQVWKTRDHGCSFSRAAGESAGCPKTLATIAGLRPDAADFGGVGHTIDRQYVGAGAHVCRVFLGRGMHVFKRFDHDFFQ